MNKFQGSGVVKVMLEELVLRQNKFSMLEKARVRWTVFILICLVGVLVFVYHTLTWNQLLLSRNVLSVFTGQPLMLLLMILIATGFVQSRYFVKKATKAEKEFEELRFEMIERNAELWEEDESWQQREVLYSYMKKEHDINLYHK